MRRIEAPTLAEAYQRAAHELSCSITDMEYEVIQHPTAGILGFFKKNAIIVAECKKSEISKSKAPKLETVVAKEIIQEVMISQESETIVTKEYVKIEKEAGAPSIKVHQATKTKNEINEKLIEQDNAILDRFYDTPHKKIGKPEEGNMELARIIEKELELLLAQSCFDIDTIEVDVVDDTALIFLDGIDAALLIGKEGYRYNALSYMIFNWLHAKHNLFIKLEIAEFITTQQEMIKNYIKPVIEYVGIHGRGKTRPLDGILVQLALEQLRMEFPNKYVAIKTGRDGRKFVIINEFNSKNHD